MENRKHFCFGWFPVLLRAASNGNFEGKKKKGGGRVFFSEQDGPEKSRRKRGARSWGETQFSAWV